MLDAPVELVRQTHTEALDDLDDDDRQHDADPDDVVVCALIAVVDGDLAEAPAEIVPAMAE